MIKKRVFIFDLDGTLVDAYRAIWASLNFTREKLGYPKVSLKEAKFNVGRGDKRFIARFFKEKDALRAVDIYRSQHKKDLLEFSKLLPGTKEVLSILKRKGKLLAIASNRPKYYTQIIVQELKIKRYFDIILCADELNSLKPEPRILNAIIKDFKAMKNEAVYIGDMDIDLETAKRAKVDAVFIKNGSSTLAEVKKYKNKKTISRLGELLNLYN